MKKTIILMPLFWLIALKISAGAVYADGKVVSQSGTIKANAPQNGFDYRVENLRRYLEKYNSPLTPFSQDFVEYADLYGIDYRLIPAITGVESTFGKRIPYKSYNAYGWANGEYKFTSWKDSINHVAMILKREYIDKGAASVAKISRRYAPPSSTWAGKVSHFIKKIDSLPVSYDI